MISGHDESAGLGNKWIEGCGKALRESRYVNSWIPPKLGKLFLGVAPYYHNIGFR